MRNSNVLQFPNGQPSGNSLKVFAILFYVALAWMLFNPTLLLSATSLFQLRPSHAVVGGEGLGLLIVLGLLYAVGIRYRSQFMNFMRGKTILLVILVILLLLSVLQYLPFLAILSGIYWLLIGRSGREAPYFLRFHLLTAMILNGLILLPLLLVQSVFGLLMSVLKLAHLDSLVSVMYGVGSFWPYVILLAFWLPAIWLSLSALMGRTPYIGLVTSNVRHWA